MAPAWKPQVEEGRLPEGADLSQGHFTRGETAYSEGNMRQNTDPKRAMHAL